MARLSVFNNVSLDGYFVDAHGDMSWAHNAAPDEEWHAFVEDNARGGGVLAFGRITYELMAGYWPTPIAQEDDPVVAERMNNGPKLVFSRTLTEASWNNTRVVADAVAEIRRLRGASGPGLAIVGSGTIVSQLARERLVDEYQVVVVPVVLGVGRTMFDGVGERLGVRLTGTRRFANGNVVLTYEPAG
jgi:dihydrofolate reductase